MLDRDLVRGWLARFGANSAGEAPAPAVDAEALPADLGRFDIMTQSLEAMQSVLTRYAVAAHPPDVMITVAKDACRTVDFHRAAEMIELGRALAIEALDAAAVPGLGA